MKRTCKKSGDLTILPTNARLQVAEEIAILSHFWAAKKPGDSAEEAKRSLEDVIDSRFVVAETLSWLASFPLEGSQQPRFEYII
ncbi:MAG: hypothetical protein AAF357_11270, partial [Verrucomicrobiota bacterium]